MPPRQPVEVLGVLGGGADVEGADEGIDDGIDEDGGNEDGPDDGEDADDGSDGSDDDDGIDEGGLALDPLPEEVCSFWQPNPSTTALAFPQPRMGSIRRNRTMSS
jgi:hypothetical protein